MRVVNVVNVRSNMNRKDTNEVLSWINFELGNWRHVVNDLEELSELLKESFEWIGKEVEVDSYENERIIVVDVYEKDEEDNYLMTLEFEFEK